jgi:hypothetical protein
MEKELLKCVKDSIITIDDYTTLTNKLNITNNNEIQEILKKIENREEYLNIYNYFSEKYNYNYKDIKKSIINNSTIKFNSNQKSSIKKIIKFMLDSIKIFGLYGYAGTGKTTLITNVITQLLDLKLIDSILITAPTNKALNVLKNKFAEYLQYFKEKFKLNSDLNFTDTLHKLKDKNIDIEFSTIHKLLKYKTDFNVDGEIIFIKDTSKNIISNYDLIIIDECSMIPITILYELFLQSATSKTKIIFLGDPAQLPPVNEKYSSIFNEDKLDINKFGSYFQMPISEDKYENFYVQLNTIKTYTLKKIMRTKNDSVMLISKLIRDWIKQEEFPELSEHIDNVYVKMFPFECDTKFTNKSKINTEWFKEFTKIIQEEKDSIIITWTNNQMLEYNNTIRKILFSDKKAIQDYEVNDILIINQLYNYNLQSENDKLHTSEKIIIKNIEKSTFKPELIKLNVPACVKNFKHYRAIQSKYEKYCQIINDIHKDGYKCWKLNVQKVDDTNIQYIINIIENTDIDLYKINLQKSIDTIKILRQQLICDYSKALSIDNVIIQPLWREHYKKFIEPYADVTYGYAITCHKAQGSNYRNVFVDFNDILKNQNELEMKKCFYTAITRTIDKLYILI